MNYDGEERQGFYIRPMMKRWWAVSLDIVKVIDGICKKHDIRWFIDSGTLLGAVREHGFIPWDDDIDIIMLRRDYERFVKVAPSGLPEGWILKNSRHDINHGKAVLRICNTENNYINMKDLERYHGCPYQVGIDIFVLDNVPDNEEECELQRALMAVTVDCILSLHGNESYDDADPVIKIKLEQLEEACGVNLDKKISIKLQLFNLSDQISAMYYDTETERVANYMYYCTDPQMVVLREAYSETVYLSFENAYLPAPVGYDEVLTSYYGENYMTPVIEHIYHDYPCFGRLEAHLKQIYEDRGLAFPTEFAE